MRITFLRHGETEHNAEGRWQGHASGRLSEAGLGQARTVGARLRQRSFEKVIVSDLVRADQTARAAGLAADPDPAWREIDVGDWAGRPHSEVAEQDAETLTRMRNGEDVKLGGGESVAEFTERVQTAFRDLAASLGEEDDALVITHGGVIWALSSAHWGLPFPNRVISPLGNTSLTTFEHRFERWHLGVYNDAGHLGPRHGVEEDDLAPDDRLLTFVRHGQTDANVQQIWQGHSDWPLNEEGRRQVGRLVDWAGRRHPVVTSPSLRAAETAAALNGGEAASYEGLKEMFMGAWENLTVQEIREGWADLFELMRTRDEDFPRGGDGERASDLMLRVRLAIGEILKDHPENHVTVVSHGSAIRSYVVSVLGGDYGLFRATGILPNTGVAQVVVGPRRSRLHTYGMAPHLEGPHLA